MSTTHAIMKGAIQGVSEFLPVSSSGHLALYDLLRGSEANFRLEESLWMHAATLIVTIWLMRHAIYELVAHMLKRTSTIENPAQQLSLTHEIAGLTLSTILTAAIALTIKPYVVYVSEHAFYLASCFMISAMILASNHAARTPKRTYSWAIVYGVLGLVQGLSVLPGISRSGSTIVAALWLGMGPNKAFRSSFLLSLPAIAGACMLELDTSTLHIIYRDHSLLWGFLSALIFGYISLRWLKHILEGAKLHYFSYYLITIALLCAASEFRFS